MTRRTTDTTEAEGLEFEELWAGLLALRGSPGADLTDWEKTFLQSMKENMSEYGDRFRVTDKQRQIVNQIWSKNYG